MAQDPASQTWIGVDEDEERYLVKFWPFNGEAPDYLQRALWDSELRNLYRLGSSPGADKSMLVVRDAGVDQAAHAFVMVLRGAGYDALSGALERRDEHPWLASGDGTIRGAMWRGLERVADGLRLLHEQNMLHRNLGADVVYFDPRVGPSSFRLGGFEWSVRLGVPALSAPPAGWSSPPEFADALAYRLETDWFAFGILAVRCFLNAERYGTNSPADRYARTLKAVERVPARTLSELERDFLLRLIAPDARDRLTRSYQILSAIDEIATRLEQRPETRSESPLVLVINPKNDELIDHALKHGFKPDPDEPLSSFNPNDLIHVSNLSMYFQRALARSQLYALGASPMCLLVGEGIDPLRISEFERLDHDTGQMRRSWDLAYCHGTGELWRNEGGPSCIQLPERRVVVRARQQVIQDRTIVQSAQSWTAYLPRIDRSDQLRASLARFHDFICATNQIELLIRDSEIFRYEIATHDTEDALERLTIREVQRDRAVMRLFRIEGGLVEFLQREIESGKRNCDLVVLTEPEEDGLFLRRHIAIEECWKVTDVNADTGLIQLARPSLGLKRPELPPIGTLRTWGMFGQVTLIRRRKSAIDRLQRHSYLLQSLSAPGQVYMDTGSAAPPVPFDSDRVDEAKQAAIEDILRVRPIYALQGPPGTGKTTLVAHLLRQILEDDPVAQILITAQAHGAVDVLREKVRDEAFGDVPYAKQPLAVRLKGEIDQGSDNEGSVRQVSLSLLERARDQLRSEKTLTKLQDDWRAYVDEMIKAIRSYAVDRAAPEFFELVKRGANLIYCTTSAADLEEIAELDQSFDWSIVEEAGKAHGFDLALPLQAGHRWLLIGDHRQLPPYRFMEYSGGIQQLDEVVEALRLLPDAAGGLLDYDWIRNWNDGSEEQREDFKLYAKAWLTTFERIFDACKSATGSDLLTIDEPSGAAAGMLSGQHRMHPTIGSLISGAYYGGELVNRTHRGGVPLPRVVHQLTAPGQIANVAVAWIDVPWAGHDERCAEHGPPKAPRYSNPAEVEALADFVAQLEINEPLERPLKLSVLSPYNQQVALINRRLREMQLPGGVELKLDLRSRAGGAGTARLAYSVDSFQGDQADIIAVSLVRNNTRQPRAGLGFLDEAQRLNVLLSRAERLLILVGSWEFFQRQLAPVQLEDPADPLWHWKTVMATLEQYFDDGRAVQIAPRATVSR